MLEELSSKDKVVGLKQVQRAVSAGRAGRVFLACDADPRLQNVQDSLWEAAIQKQFKIFTYVDTNGCTECQLKLYDWEILHKKLDSLNKNATILYIVHNKFPQYIESIKKRNNITFPFFIDEENKIGKINHLSSKLLYRTFLLDSMNKIILFGNPIQNEQIWNLYKQTITNK